MKLFNDCPRCLGLQVVHLLANIVRGWIHPQREGKAVNLTFPPSRLNSIVSYPSFRKWYLNSPQSWFFTEIVCGDNTACCLAHGWEKKRNSASSCTSVLLAARSSAGIKAVPSEYSWDTHPKGLSCCRAMLPSMVLPHSCSAALWARLLEKIGYCFSPDVSSHPHQLSPRKDLSHLCFLCFVTNSILHLQRTALVRFASTTVLPYSIIMTASLNRCVMIQPC